MSDNTPIKSPEEFWRELIDREHKHKHERLTAANELQMRARTAEVLALSAEVERLTTANELLQAERDVLRSKLASLRLLSEQLARVLGADRPWPLASVLLRLADAVEHLQREHGCDRHGYEEDWQAVEEALRYSGMARSASLEVQRAGLLPEQKHFDWRTNKSLHATAAANVERWVAETGQPVPPEGPERTSR